MTTRRASSLALMIVLAAGLAACSSAPAAKSTAPVRVVEKNAEGQEHRALPETLEGCEYLGRVRANRPSGCTSGCGLLEMLQSRAARKGGDTLVALPGAPVEGDGMRGSVFRCGGTAGG